MRLVAVLALFLISFLSSAQAWVFNVYGDLTQSLGHTQRENPKLILEDSKDYIARYSSRKNTIFLEKAVVQFAEQKFGERKKDAIAYILAHELGHFVYDHGWMRRTGERFASNEAIRELYKIGISREQLLADEATADAYAGLVTVLTGYSSIDIADDLLTGLYEAYSIPEVVEGYPSLQERLALISTVDEYVALMRPIYWAGNYALLIGDYDGAVNCFRNLISRQLGNAEIYNNLGLAFLMQARKMTNTGELRIYPLPLVEAASDNLQISLNPGNDARALLLEAVTAFETSITLNSKNLPAYLNNIVALDMLYQSTGDEDFLEDTRYWIRKATRLQDGETSQIGFLSEVIRKGNDTFELGSETDMSIQKRDDRVILDPDLKAAVEGKVKFDRTIDLEDHVLEVANNANAIYYRLRPNRIMTAPTTVMYEVTNNYRRPSPDGVTLNSDVASLIARMGEPEEEITDGPNLFYGYESRNIIFRIRGGVVKGWINYRVLNAR